MPKERIKVVISSLEFSGPRDPDKVIEIHVFVWDLNHKPCLRLLGISESEVVIASVQMGSRIFPPVHHGVHIQQITSGE